MMVRVVAVAAVGILRVAVGLDLARVGTDEARGTGGELSEGHRMLVNVVCRTRSRIDLHHRLGRFRLGKPDRIDSEDRRGRWRL